MSRRRLTEKEIYDLLMESDIEEMSDDEARDEEVEKSICTENYEDIIIDTAIKYPEQNQGNDENEHLDEPLEHIVIATAQDDSSGYINENVIIEFFDQAEADRETIPFTNKSDIQWHRKNIAPEDNPNFEDLSSEDECLTKSPYEYFNQYLTDELFETFSFHTNLYAQQQDAKFKVTDKHEIKRLFGLHVFIGSIKLSRLRLYWEPRLGIQAFKSSMTCDRFSQLRNNLHMVINLDIQKENTDKFVKVRPMINAVRNRCLKLPVEEVVSIDEQIIPYTGQLATKQYIKGKPNPWGIKVYVLAGKSGQPYDFFLYQGATSGLSPAYQSKYGFGASVVIKLVERLNRPGHLIFFDNFFSTYQLFEYLVYKKYNAVGTIRINRFCTPPFITDKELSKQGRGSCDQVVSMDGKVILVKWQDNKAIYIGSNFVGTGDVDIVKRWNKITKKYQEVSRPEIVRLYNSGMGGVDSLDQFISYYRVFIKSRKWTLRVITHFLDFALAASWSEYRREMKNSGKPEKEILDLLYFRLEVGDALLYAGQTANRSKRGRPSTSRDCSPLSPITSKRSMEVRPIRDVRRDEIAHFPYHDGMKEATRCKMNCKTSHQGTAGRTHFACRKCNVHLCITKERNCFEVFHSK